MTLENELRLSYYREIAAINEKHAVKLVQHTETGQIFVLKTLKIYDIRVFRYLKEARLPGVPEIEELIEDDGTLHVIEEYVSGVSLRDKIDAEGKMDEKKASDIIIQLCLILCPLHSLRIPIIHRDIKPENIIIDTNDKISLIDFNSAKESNSKKSQDTILFGTAGYAAPEQYGFSESAPSADIYAIGVVLNELLTGKLPTQKLYDGKLKKIIDKCLKMDPADRYKNTDDLIHAIYAIINPHKTVAATVRSFLPPGINSPHPFVCFTSALLYTALTAVCLTLNLTNVYGWPLVACRILFLIFFISEILWIGNYRNIQMHFPLSKSKNTQFKILGIIIWGAALFFLFLLVSFIIAEQSRRL